MSRARLTSSTSGPPRSAQTRCPPAREATGPAPTEPEPWSRQCRWLGRKGCSCPEPVEHRAARPVSRRRSGPLPAPRGGGTSSGQERTACEDLGGGGFAEAAVAACPQSARRAALGAGSVVGPVESPVRKAACGDRNDSEYRRFGLGCWSSPVVASPPQHSADRSGVSGKRARNADFACLHPSISGRPSGRHGRGPGHHGSPR